MSDAHGLPVHRERLALMDDERAEADWDPLADSARRDLREVVDELRERCPVAWSPTMGWSVLRHADVLRVVEDHATFSNAVSRHRSVPNGLDPPEHAEHRRLVERVLGADRVRTFEPACRRIARDLVGALPGTATVELMGALARPFAARAQCAFLGWPEALAGTLIDWVERNQRATREQDRDALSGLAAELQGIITAELDRRRGQAPEDHDVTGRLLHETVGDQPPSDSDIASLLRNWTAGEVGSLSAAVGIVLQHLAGAPDLQHRLRAEPERVPFAIEEILRVDGPLVANRRITTRSVVIGGRQLPAGAPVSVVWISANRDPAAFAEPDRLRLDRDLAASLLWGAGIHVCPGAPLARLELRVIIDTVIGSTTLIAPAPGERAPRSRWPAAGPETLPLRLHRRRPG
jgi:cytochrome P450